LSSLRFIVQQIAAVFVALLILVVIDQVLGFLIFPAHSSPREVRYKLSGYVRNWNIASTPDRMREILKQNNVLIFGSSELTSKTGREPYVFLPEHMGQTAMAFGGGGAQSLTILTNLLANRDLLSSKSRIVIILSPWWFLTSGTEASTFREFTHAEALAKIAADAGIAESTKEPLYRFMKRQLHHLTPPTFEMLAFRFPGFEVGLRDLIEDVRFTIPEFVREHSRIYQSRLTRTYLPATEKLTRTDFNWEQELRKAEVDKEQNSRSNQYGFLDLQWPNYKNTVPRELHEPDPESNEVKDLEVLVRFLHEQNVPALFIQQPINALAYLKIERFDPVRERINELMTENQMHYVDYLSLDYQKTMLVDLAHLSAYGWLKVDRDIQIWLETLR
jgi:D-alanine transfer protein